MLIVPYGGLGPAGRYEREYLKGLCSRRVCCRSAAQQVRTARGPRAPVERERYPEARARICLHRSPQPVARQGSGVAQEAENGREGLELRRRVPESRDR